MQSNAALVLDGKTYEVDTIYQRTEGPGIVNTRFRIPDYPLNVYTLEMDLNNPFNTIETNIPNGKVGTQETLAGAYARHEKEGKTPIAGANANFWVVTGHGPAWQFMLGTNFGGSVLDGKMITETNHDNLLDYIGRGAMSMDKNKRLWGGPMTWTGTISSPNLDTDMSIYQFNKRSVADELGAFTAEYGRDKEMLTTSETDNIFLTLDENQSWAVNEPVVFTVRAIQQDSANMKLGDYDLCLAGSGDKREALRKLAIGDKVTLKYYWKVIQDGTIPEITQFIEGNQCIVANGEVTPENDTDGYCSMVYSRCGYGCSKDGKKLFVIIIDMSTNEYGVSKGCPSRVMSQIFKEMGCWTAVNMDAGGSAQMMVKGKVINKTTESTPRAVSTTWLLYSTAPKGDNEIASIKFDDYKLQMPTSAMYSPKILGYNKYGELVSEDIKGVTFSCPESIGSCSGNVINANSTPGTGLLTATYNGLSVEKPLTTIDTVKPNINIKPILVIDGHREYPVEISSTIGHSSYIYNPAQMNWTCENPDIIEINNGVLKGKSNGESKLLCKYLDFADTTLVKVQIADAPYKNTDWSLWTAQGVGAKNINIGNDGVIKFDFSTSRGPYMSISCKEDSLYSLPDRLVMEFTSTIPVSYINADISNAQMSYNIVKYQNNESSTFQANVRNVVNFGIENMWDLTQLSMYPLKLKSLKFVLPNNATYNGQHTITIHKLETQYDNYAGVDEVRNDENSIRIFPNPVADGVVNIASISDIVYATIYSLTGEIVLSQPVTTGGNSSTVSVSNLAKGIYIVKLDAGNETCTQKLVIK